VYAFFLALREPHVVTIDPLPPSTSPTRDAVPNHHRNSSSSAQFASAISPVSSNPPPSGRSHITGASTLVPATRPRSELEGENRIDALPQLPEIRPCAPTSPYRRNRFDALSWNSHSSDTANERARKRQRLETTSSDPEIASSSRLGTSTVQHDPLSENTFSMRLPEREYDTNPTSPDFRPRASSSLSPSPKTNGHVANGCGSPINGSSKRSRGRVAKVELPGATIYDDSYIDREEYIRLVIQSLRDIGYMCVFDYVPLI
jgi:hypothetical protein